MSEILKLATVVVYADDAPATYYDADLGFASLGEEQTVAIASHEAGMLMLAERLWQARSNQVRGTELAFWTRDVVAVLPWGQTVAPMCRHRKVRSSLRDARR